MMRSRQSGIINYEIKIFNLKHPRFRIPILRFRRVFLIAIFWHAAETIDFTGVYVFLARFGISFESSIATLNI